jgi:hypothetical protein
VTDNRHGAYIRRVQEDAQRCAQTLLAENERLRSRVALLEATREESERRLRDAEASAKITYALRALAAALESEKLRLQQELSDARTELEHFREERAALERQLAGAEAESRRAAREYAEVEQRSANLANLYVAAYQLHDTLDRAAVLAAIREIIVNLVGSEEFAVLELSQDDGTLSPAEWSGIAPEELRAIGTDRIGQIARAGEVFVGQQERLAGDLPLTACIPLKVAGHVTGAIAIFRLLAHKPRLEAADRELFDLLATQAGTALYCTRLHEAAQSRDTKVT